MYLCFDGKTCSPEFMVLNFKTVIDEWHKTGGGISLLFLVSSADLQALIPS